MLLIKRIIYNNKIEGEIKLTCENSMMKNKKIHYKNRKTWKPGLLTDVIMVLLYYYNPKIWKILLTTIFPDPEVSYDLPSHSQPKNSTS